MFEKISKRIYTHSFLIKNVEGMYIAGKNIYLIYRVTSRIPFILVLKKLNLLWKQLRMKAVTD